MQKQCFNTVSNLHTYNMYLESTLQQVAVHSDLVQRFQAGENIQSRLQHASILELQTIAEIIRHRILEVVSKNGGHLSSTLGAVELIIGMHTVFNCRENPFIYDVSHQAYAHKLLTGRYNDFDSLRQFNGISGFVAPYESEYDYFIAGHSSTSLSLAVGVAKAKKLKNLSTKPVVMIGDGAMSAGLVYEALNELGDLRLPVVIVLNDNEMSIAKPIGVMSKILSKTIASPFYQTMREKIKKIVDKMPDSAAFIAKRFEESFKLITPGLLFEEFGIDYIGPIDGNDIEEVVETLKSVQNTNRPVLIHCQTIKGKGYKIAEGRYEKWHGVAPFDLLSGKPLSTSMIQSPTSVFSNKLLKMARNDSRIVGVTAAMPSGTGLDKLIDEYPHRFFDVAIAEQHATASMAAMAKEGMKPYIAIYSTFLQRAFDQIIHDVSIMKLPVVFCIDRAGIVGEDGETHQGLFDVAYLRMIPNFTLLSPRSNQTLEYILDASVDFDTPTAFRYPRGRFLFDLFLHDYHNNKEKIFRFLLQEIQDKMSTYTQCLKCLQSQMLVRDCWQHIERDNKQKKNILIIGYGNGVGRGLHTIVDLYINYHIVADLLDLVYLKPLDSKNLMAYFEEYDIIFVLSDNYKINGVASAIMELANDLYNAQSIKKIPKIVSFEIEDNFIKHGKIEKVEEHLEISPNILAYKISNIIKNN